MRLTGLEHIDICGAELSDVTPLARLTNLNELYLRSNGISDLSPIAGLTGLNRLELSWNRISDVSPLAGLTNLKWLSIRANNISDISPLDGLRENLINLILEWYGNPAFSNMGGPKIEGPWLWVYLPGRQLNSGADLLSEASKGAATVAGVSTNGAIEGTSVGQDGWTVRRLAPEGWSNISDMMDRDIDDGGTIFGAVSLYAPHKQDVNMFVGSEGGLKVWLNGVLKFEDDGWWNDNYSDFFPVTLRQGRNVLLVAVGTNGSKTNGFFGFEPGTEYTVANAGVGYAFSETPLHVGDTFTFGVRAEDVFDPALLEAIDVSEGGFLKTDGESTFFQQGRIDNTAGKITGLKSARLSDSGVSGSGNVLQIKFKAKSHGETRVALQNFKFGSSTGETIPAGPHEIHITVEQSLPTGDVNRDGDVDILDLILVAQQLGKSVPANSPVDINGDGVVNIFDLTLVAQGIGGAAAPAARGIDSATIEMWIAQARLADDGSIAFRQAIANLEVLLASMIPSETALLPNYPNPFNPETWIPYQLAVPAEVALTIYDMNGGTVRRLEVGHQAAGMYQNRGRALYWDGRNQRGESVASGLYFYTLTAGEFTATRKMLIRK